MAPDLPGRQARRFALVVKWISQRSSEPLLGVRIPPGASATEPVNYFTGGRDSKDFSVRAKRDGKVPAVVGRESLREHLKCGYRLVVGHVLAKDEVGVRFSLSAQNMHFVLLFPSDSPLKTPKTVDNSGDNGDKRQ